MTDAVKRLVDVTKNRTWQKGVKGALGANPTVQAMLIDIAHAAVEALPELEAMLNPWPTENRGGADVPCYKCELCDMPITQGESRVLRYNENTDKVIRAHRDCFDVLAATPPTKEVSDE